MGNKKIDSLACPNQLRSFGVTVDERPSAFFPNKHDVQQIVADNVFFPLKLKGPLSYLSVRRPTLREIQNDNIQHIHLTSPHGWDPYGVDSFTSSRSSTIMCRISYALSQKFPVLLQP